jgi:hypothetical protein
MDWFSEHIVELLSVIVSTVVSLYIAKIAILQNKRITEIEHKRQEQENFIFFKIERDGNYIETKDLDGRPTRSYARENETGETKLTDCPLDTFDKISLTLKNVGNAHAEIFQVIDFELLYFNPIYNVQKKFTAVEQDKEIFKRSYVLRDDTRIVSFALKQSETQPSTKSSNIEIFSINIKIKYIDAIIKKPIIENIRFNGNLEGFEYKHAANGIPSDYEELKLVFDSSAVTYSI